MNIILLQIEGLGINGAIISSVISQMVSAIIVFVALKRSMRMKFKIGKFLIKPIIRDC
ncbi:MAG: polysaccharide biosynthesis C-terminal domain-containing protein [Oscillospiraceae bacterium]|nr:polysaccharide biosynthesis C-terminal domain-containing protein [Oscillospiraceae bacterium]